MKEREPAETTERSDFAAGFRKGVLIGAAALLVIFPAAVHFAPHFHAAHQQVAKAKPGAQARRHADFANTTPSDDARRIANWVADSRDNGNHSFVVLDKRQATVYLFDRDAHLKASAPAVLGSAIGDETYPGVGDKELAQLRPEEKTTPAGRFVGEIGESSSRGEDVVWIDYEAAVSMHRVIKAPARLAALQTPGPEDNRLSNGCVNVPDAFYEGALRPAVDREGVVFYVLPDTRSLTQTFASFYDVDAPTRVAQH